MKIKKTQKLKRLATLMLACAVALTAVLVPVPAKAADTSVPTVLKQYILQKGEKWQPTVYYTDDDATVTYSINKKAVATVNKKGVVTAKKPGKATLTYIIQNGGKTYKAKTAITVKANMALYEYVKRANPELSLMYVSFYELLEAGDLLDDPEVQEALAEFDEVVQKANKIIKNPNKYTDEEIQDELDAIQQIAQYILEALGE